MFSLSLSYPVIDPSSEIANDIISTVEKKLLTPYGLKTLAKGEEGYKESYEGDMVKRDMSYHQGTIWPWLLGLYYDALNNMIKSEKKKSIKQELEKKKQEFKEEVRTTFVQEMNENSTVGNIRELYSKIGKDYKPDGTFAQAWSVSEIFRIIL